MASKHHDQLQAPSLQLSLLPSGSKRRGRVGRIGTYLFALGALENTLPVIVVNGIGDAHRLADDVDAAEDAARGGRGEGEDCGLFRLANFNWNRGG